MTTPLVMPDGKLAPSVLTWREVALLFRLEGNERSQRNTLAYYRQSGKLRGKKIGKEIKYTTSEIVRFLETQ